MVFDYKPGNNRKIVLASIQKKRGNLKIKKKVEKLFEQLKRATHFPGLEVLFFWYHKRSTYLVGPSFKWGQKF